jgi:hypothetical protein
MNNKKSGQYFKYYDREDDITIAFVAVSDHADNHQIINKKLNCCRFQTIPNDETVKQYPIAYFPYNLWGQITNDAMIIKFDFDAETVQMNGKIFQVIDDDEWAFKATKTAIKCYEGVNGLYDFITNCMDSDDPFNMSMYHRLKDLVNKK